MDKFPTKCEFCKGPVTKEPPKRLMLRHQHLKFGKLHCPKCKLTWTYAVRLRPLKEKIDKQAVLNLLNDIGGCCATNEYFKGWDDAISAAYRDVKNLRPD